MYLAGKTCLANRYSVSQFSTEYIPTIFDNLGVEVKVGGKSVSLGIWDTPGQEDYDKFRPVAYPNAVYISSSTIICLAKTEKCFHVFRIFS